MYEYRTSVEWKGGQAADILSEEKPPLDMSAPEEFGGRKDRWSPEDLLVASVESCLLLTTLYFVEKMKIDLKGYQSEGVGRMEQTENGFRFQGIDVRIRAEVATGEDAEKMKKAVEKADKYCPVSNAVTCPVVVELEAVVP